MKNSFDRDSLAQSEIRLKSQRFVQCLFGCFTLGFAALAQVAHLAPQSLILDQVEGTRIANTFLALASLYLMCLLVWERIYPAHDTADPSRGEGS